MTNPSRVLTVGELLHRLRAVKQEHVLKFWDDLTESQQFALAAQVASLDLASIPGLVREYVLAKPAAAASGTIEPAPYYPLDAKGPKKAWDPAAMRALGESLLRAGKVACFTVAGGQGSRLGYEGPKGCYPAGAVTNKPLFEMFAEGVLGAARRYGATVPWYVMTSPLNHETTVEFFEANRYFGLRRGDVMFFPQGVLPSFDIRDGKMLMASRHEIATNPDGHGGSLKALHVSGALDDMTRRGVEHISYFQVDNPLVRVVDPVFLGLHAGAPDSSEEMSSKMVAKASAGEKVGVFCSVDGRTQVIEYSDMPGELTNARDEKGHLRFNAGSIAVHVLSVEFVRRLNTMEGFELAYHRAEKKVPCIDLQTGEPVNPPPTTNNAVKLERFVFDALPLCGQAPAGVGGMGGAGGGAAKTGRGSIVMETDRVEEFAPIKNATGPDSPQTCRELQTLRAARWLSAAGVKVPLKADGTPDCVLELSPLTAMFPEDLRAAGAKVPGKINPGEKIAL
jgi:UDP-N-acetylglucosamine/UDP-N-acetylgalactosamine diphosphorylase